AAPFVGSPSAPKIAIRPSPRNLSRIPPVSSTHFAMDSQVRVQDGDDLPGRERLGERGRAAQVREEDRHGLPLALEPERIAGDDALDDRRREEALEATPAVELDEERAEREDRRDEHEAVVLPPCRRPGGPKELRDLSLREEEVRDSERALQRQLRAQYIAALREHGYAARDDDDRHAAELQPPR